MSSVSKYHYKGFTLVELLVALAILGEIAVLTIPKILTSQQNGRYKATGKEMVSMVSDGFQQYKLTGALTSSTRSSDITPYFNYISLDSSGTLIDKHPGSDSSSCDATNICLKMHNGGVLRPVGMNFSGTNATNAVAFLYDPDGVYGGTTQGPSKSLSIWIYYNGRVTSRGQIAANTCSSIGCNDPDATEDPSWFSW